MLSHQDKWIGDYKGVRYEILHWELGWNYYLVILKNQFPKIEPFLKLNNEEEYANAPIISELEWHGGITYYESMTNSYKLGCDYMHAFDTRRTYTLDMIDRDAKQSIDKLMTYLV